MDNMDDSENNAKVSDSVYSNSCNNSQSRRSRSSKCTNYGSNSSGSSGYGGKPSDYCKNELPVQLQQKKGSKEKDCKKKKSTQMNSLPPQTQTGSENRNFVPISKETSKEDTITVGSSPPLAHALSSGAGSMDVVITEKNSSTDENVPLSSPASDATGSNIMLSVDNSKLNNENGFSCVISMHDGIVIYTTSSLTVSLGFPKHMWIGRSFIDFVHPSDRLTFAAQITNGLAVPKSVNGTPQTAPTQATSVSTMVCRIRRYRGLTTGFVVKERKVCYTPYLLKLSFKNITDEDGKVIYLVIQATQFVSAFKVPNEPIINAAPFVIRHDANGILEYIDPESVPYLGYLPQDICEKDALQFYHPEDLEYLCQVYEAIVKEESLDCSKPFRMLAQNGDYLKVETEWSSFINPWSRKLEFVIGKHHIIEGPQNPDVFQPPKEKAQKQTTEEKVNAQNLRDTIVRIMNEVLTKPAEMVKNQMTKRCQDLATFMENLIENQPTIEDELRVDVNDADQTCYERDSVMLGGISPHHDYNDSKASSETPLSYNQLNYNENLQRYFDRHQPYSYEDYNTIDGDNVLAVNGIKKGPPGTSASSIAQLSGDSNEISSIGEAAGMFGGNSLVATPEDYQPVRLTEFLLCKHNTEMEKELVKTHKETRSVNKADREKASYECKVKKKEHLPRCSNSFQPLTMETECRPHGLKRASKVNLASSANHKHHCPTPRSNRRRQPTSTASVLPSSTTTTTVAAETQWPAAPVNNINTFLLGVGIPQQMSVLSPMSTVPGVYPLYYTPTGNPLSHVMSTSTQINSMQPTYGNPQLNQQSVHCMLYGQAVYGSPIMYTPVTPHMSYSLQDNLMEQTVQFSNTFVNPALSSNKRRLQKAGVSNIKSKVNSLWRDKKRTKLSKVIDENADSSNSSNNTLNQSAVMGSNTLSTISKSKNHLGNSEYRTDGESSYSSFYSSFFKTDSGSAEESDKKQEPKVIEAEKNPFFDSQKYKVCVSSELIYKYQVVTKSLEEVLQADKESLSKLEQPSLVNEQLSQLYLDLQLEGVAAKLTLEEEITSSSSSGEETCSKSEKMHRRKRVYSKLALIYEEESPLPPPSPDADILTESTTTAC